MDDYGSQRDWDANDLSDDGDDEELQAVDEFGTRRGKNKLVQQYSDGLGSINKDGTRSFLNGWCVLFPFNRFICVLTRGCRFGLDTVRCTFCASV